MGKKSRDKGLRNERNLVTELRESGLPAERVPLSGAAGGAFSGDLIVCDLRFEAKARKDGFKELHRWLADNDGLFLKTDRKEQLVVLPMRIFRQLLWQIGWRHKPDGTSTDSTEHRET